MKSIKESLISKISEDLEISQVDLEKIIAFQGEDALSSVRIVKEIEFSGFGKFLINKNKVKNKIKVKERTIQGLITSGKNDIAEAIKPELEYYKSKL